MTLATLAQCGHVKRKAADILGVSLKTLYNRLEVYNGRGGEGHEVVDALEAIPALPAPAEARSDEDRWS